ncbi:hypothetical protein AtNW77_Chr1g0039381 [Arabidopsis thaliana]
MLVCLVLTCFLVSLVLCVLVSSFSLGSMRTCVFRSLVLCLLVLD